jgi:hypothetical protein
MAKMLSISRDFNAYGVAGYLSGRQNITVLLDADIGSSYG